jgi:hypothetical protein
VSEKESKKRKNIDALKREPKALPVLQPSGDTSAEWTDVSAHRKRGKAQRNPPPYTPPTSTPPRTPPPHLQPTNVSVETAAAQRKQSKAQKSGKDASIRTDIMAGAAKRGGHVGTGGGAVTSGGGEAGSRRSPEMVQKAGRTGKKPVCVLPTGSDMKQQRLEQPAAFH